MSNTVELWALWAGGNFVPNLAGGIYLFAYRDDAELEAKDFRPYLDAVPVRVLVSLVEEAVPAPTTAEVTPCV